MGTDQAEFCTTVYIKIYCQRQEAEVTSQKADDIALGLRTDSKTAAFKIDPSGEIYGQSYNETQNQEIGQQNAALFPDTHYNANTGGQLDPREKESEYIYEI